MWQILKTNGINPTPDRSEAAVACDFFAARTALLSRYYVLFFIDIPTRRVFLAGVTANPTRAWTAQAARERLFRQAHQLSAVQALVLHRGAPLVGAFGEIFPTSAYSR